MSKGLEALTYFKMLFDIWKEKISVDDDTKEVEEEYEFKPRYELIEKELKALEIIKAIRAFDVYEDIGGKYHLETMVDNVGLMKEEYDLLREVML